MPNPSELARMQEEAMDRAGELPREEWPITPRQPVDRFTFTPAERRLLVDGLQRAQRDPYAPKSFARERQALIDALTIY